MCFSAIQRWISTIQDHGGVFWLFLLGFFWLFVFFLTTSNKKWVVYLSTFIHQFNTQHVELLRKHRKNQICIFKCLASGHKSNSHPLGQWCFEPPLGTLTNTGSWGSLSSQHHYMPIKWFCFVFLQGTCLTISAYKGPYFFYDFHDNSLRIETKK